MAGRTKIEADRVMLQIRVNRELREKADILAKNDCRTIGNFVEALIMKAIKEAEDNGEL